VTTGVAITSDNTFFANNELDHFGDDGLDCAGSNLKIYHNYIHDNNDLADGNHEDAMQGQNGSIPAGLTYNSFSNIVIDSNRVIRQTDPKLMFPAYLQGVDAFDEDWTNITVTNNMVITSSCWGIVYSSIHNSLIANNTIVDDGLFVTPGCGPEVSVGDKTHEGPSSNDVQITNNVTSGLAYYNLDPGVTADHNIITLQTGFSNLSCYVNGAPVFYSAARSVDGTNLIDNDGAAGEFTTFSPST
jgi:Right handed beta helix region